MTITLINDCKDENVVGRQIARASALLHAPAALVGVSSDLEAAGNIIDALDAVEKASSIILANVAPRHGKAKKWPNGTPFGYFWYQNTLVVSTIDGVTLSLVKKLGLVKTISVVDIAQVVGKWSLSQEEQNHIVNSQFRSFDFTPRLAAHLWQKREVPHTDLAISKIPNPPPAVWWVDNFGNCKTTLVAKDVAFVPGTKVSTTVGKLTCYSRLKDVPNNTSGLIIGSSGIGHDRFLEIVIQGQSAASHFGLSTGSLIR